MTNAKHPRFQFLVVYEGRAIAGFEGFRQATSYCVLISKSLPKPLRVWDRDRAADCFTSEDPEAKKFAEYWHQVHTGEREHI